MKKRILSMLLMCCMVLTLLPTAVSAESEWYVDTEEALVEALANEACGTIRLTADISVSSTLIVDRAVTLYLHYKSNVNLTMTGSGSLFHVTGSGSLRVPGGIITGDVTNDGAFSGDVVMGTVTNAGVISDGGFQNEVTNTGTISGGRYTGRVTNQGGQITGGKFQGEVINDGTISGGTFYGKVTNQGGAEAGGQITGGEFYGEVINEGVVSGGSFYDTMTGGGELRDSAKVTVTFDSDGGSAVDSPTFLRGQKAQRPADPIRDGYTFIGWYNNGTHYPGAAEWAFSTPVTDNLTLTARWMPTRPVSAEPVTYLDADGKEQVCTQYTVLESSTADSILDLDNKWYDLPAGWYVAEGDVTITPRVDTHGEVNLILKDGCHFTAEWGINVKEGDTFTVYAQSAGEDTMGKLTACLPDDFNSDGSIKYYVWPDSGLAGIGAGRRFRGPNDGFAENEGTIIINGGNIRAKGQWASSAIGGPCADYIVSRVGDEPYNLRQGGTILINGGIIQTENITKGNYTAPDSVGIGTCQFGYGGSVIINGGTVNVNAANDAICTGRGGSITINGGDVTAHAGINEYEEGVNPPLRGNGIGSYLGGTVTINGGHIKTCAEGEGSGIGSFRVETPVIINGGTIEAVASSQSAAIGGKGSVAITGGVIDAAGKGGAAGIGGDGDIRITGGEISVSAEGGGAAIGGNAGVDCGSITVQGDVIRAISSADGACIGGAARRSAGTITILDATLSPLSGKGILIGWNSSAGGDLTIRNSRIVSTAAAANLSGGICVGGNSELLIENSEVRLLEDSGVCGGDGASIAIRDSKLHTYGIYTAKVGTNDKPKLNRLEITGSTVVTGGNIGTESYNTYVGAIVIHGSSVRLCDEQCDNSCTIGCGQYGAFDSIDIQDSQIDIPFSGTGAAIGSSFAGEYKGESRIRIANSRVDAASWMESPAIGAGRASWGGSLQILIENSTVTAQGGGLHYPGYVPGIGRNTSYSAPELTIQIMDSTVESFRHTVRGARGDYDLVYDDLHEKNLPGIPAENISFCGSTINGTRVEHDCDAYGRCGLCGKYDLGYCYEHGLLTIEGLADCAYDGGEKTLTGLSHLTDEGYVQLAEGTDYTAAYSNNVYPYAITPDDAGFDPAEAPRVALYGTGSYCGRAEHCFTIGGDVQPSYTVTFDTAGGTAIGDKTDVRWDQRVLDGVEPPARTGYVFLGWNCNGQLVLPRTTYAELAGHARVQTITLTAQWEALGYPTGEIRIDESTAWQRFQLVTFDLFYNQGKTVTITAQDVGGEPVEIEYLIADAYLSPYQCSTMELTPYIGPFRIEPDGQYAVYAKLTNAAGEVTYLSSNGIVLDATAPVIEGIEDGGVYYEAVTVTVTDANLASVTVNGSPVALDGKGQFVLSPANGAQRIAAADRAGNRTEMTVRFPAAQPVETVITTPPTLPAEGYVGDEFLNEALTGGEARAKGTDTAVPGTFTFKNRGGGRIAAAGENHMEVLFTPTDAETYAAAECVVTVTGIKRTVTETEKLPDITDKPLGTAFESLGLPAGVQVRTNTDAFYAPIPVIWDASAYDPNTLEEQTITGKLDIAGSLYADRLEPTDTVRAAVKVTLADNRVFTPELTPPAYTRQLYGGDLYVTAFSNGNLSGGAARANGEPVAGTFALDETQLIDGSLLTASRFLKAGPLELKVIFTPDDQTRYTTAECTVPVNVLPRKFVSANTVYITDKTIGTAFEDLGLPDYFCFFAVGDENNPEGTGINFSMPADITWDGSAYDAYSAEPQTICGKVEPADLSDYFILTEADCKALVEVTLQPDPAATEITVLPVFQWNRGAFALPDNTMFSERKFQAGTYGDETGALVGGEVKVKGTDTVVPGTFSFKEGTPGFFDTLGDNDVTVVFTPENTLLHARAECTVTIHVVRNTLKEVMDVPAVTDKRIGTPFADLGLPKYVGVVAIDGYTVSMEVAWEPSSYDADSPEEQTITGTLVFDQRDERTYQQPEPAVTAAVRVKLIASAAAPAITTDSLPDGAVGTAYSQTLTAAGTAPITWRLIDGALPDGLRLNMVTGEISGTPVTEGTASFTVRAENSEGSDDRTLRITIAAAGPVDPTRHTVTITTDGNGTALAAPSAAEANTEIILYAEPNDGYQFRQWLVVSPAGLTVSNDRFIMPDCEVEIRAVFERIPAAEHTVRFDGNGGTPAVDSMTTIDQKLPSLPGAWRRNHRFDGWYTEMDGGERITTDTVFFETTTVFAHWTDIGGSGGDYNPPAYYTLRFETGGGSGIASVRGTYNTYIDLTEYVPTWRGRTFIGWYRDSGRTDRVSGVYLTGNMTVYAGWRVDENQNPGTVSFTDVSESDWFCGDVLFACENGLMLGAGQTLFSPYGSATRGMMATILWRMEGSPAPKGPSTFADVEAGMWYADAVAWATENGIFAGYGEGLFGPDDCITREQLAAIFYRYADYKGCNPTGGENLDGFADADQISEYAGTAVQWAVGSGVLNGKPGNLLDPQGTATRAEIAAMLHRFMKTDALAQGKAPGGLMD